MDFDDLGIPAGRDPEYPSQIWAPPHRCLHPYESVSLQAAHFPALIEQAVFRLDCFACGAFWDQTNAPGWVYDYMARMIDDGKFHVVHRDKLSIVGDVKWEQTKYGKIFDAITGDSNPISSSKIQLRRPD
ncbi:hypothetical protein [Saccharopolyspora hattusasensis]|uniref:hypothetical protein n=1 Tax=Saccharopolyspora hattusasensis TaxID=1128679 RepID=UPI003D98006B